MTKVDKSHNIFKGIKNMKNHKKNFILASIYFILFIIWTIAISTFDVQKIGPKNSAVGFAKLNEFFHNLTGKNMLLYNITDYLSLIPIFIVICFGIIGLSQLIKRKNILKVDSDILILGCFYIIVFTFYVIFEEIPINYRPILIQGKLEVSYPSSTTLLVLTIMPTAILQIISRISNYIIKNSLLIICIVFTMLMVLGRLLSGVHWLTDIIGGIILSISLVKFYYSFTKLANSKNKIS